MVLLIQYNPCGTMFQFTMLYRQWLPYSTRQLKKDTGNTWKKSALLFKYVCVLSSFIHFQLADFRLSSIHGRLVERIPWHLFSTLASNICFLQLTGATPLGENGQTVLLHVGEDDVLATENVQTPRHRMEETTVRVSDLQLRRESVIKTDVQVFRFFANMNANNQET